MLLGIWKNIEELEQNVTLEELNAIVNKSREIKHQQNKFLAAMKGIDLDQSTDQEERFNEVQRRVEAKLSGKSKDEIEFQDFGIDFVT